MVAPYEIGRQFGRVVRVRIQPPSGPPLVINPITPSPAGVQPPALHVSFSVSKSLTSEPQRASVQIVNLSKTTRDLIASFARRPPEVTSEGLTVDSRVFRGTRVTLEAGYLGISPTVIFVGDLASARSRHVATEWLTSLELGDSEVALTQAECRRAFEIATPAIDVIRYAVQVLGMQLGPAPIPTAIAQYVLQKGFVAYGKARDTIDAILAGCAPDLSQLNALARGVVTIGSFFDAFTGTAPLTNPVGWWAEDGLAYFLERGFALPAQPVVVSPEAEAGAVRLLERPERLDEGGVRVRMLLHPALRIGRPLQVISKELAGSFRVEALSHTGDNRTGPFESVADLRILASA